MIKISMVSKKTANNFNENEWDKVNDVHFGKGVRWNETPFRFKATQNGKIVGLIYGKHESGTIYIRNIIVAKKYRRKGIGKMLMQKAEEFGKSFNDHKMWVITGKHYSEDPFFRKLGFIKQAVLPKLYFNKDFVVYIKNIT